MEMQDLISESNFLLSVFSKFEQYEVDSITTILPRYCRRVYFCKYAGRNFWDKTEILYFMKVHVANNA